MPSLNTGNAILSNPIKVDSSYNVGIGGAASGSYKLQVTGTGNFTGALSGTSASFSGNVTQNINDGTIGLYKADGTTPKAFLGNPDGSNTDEGYLELYKTSVSKVKIRANGNSYFNGGNVGIGTSSPTNLAASYRSLCVNGSSAGFFETRVGDVSSGRYISDSNGTGIGDVRSGKYLYLYTEDTERMRITSGGQVTIQTPTSGVALLVNGKASDWAGQFQGVITGSASFGVKIIAGTGSNDAALLIKNAADNTDYFRVRGDGYMASVPTYNNTYSNAANMYVGNDGFMGRSTSSIKYKENVLDYTKGLAEIMQLRPVSYTSKNPTEEGQNFAGLIAEEVHELGLTEFVQYAEDGSPDALAYQNMVSLLVKAIQEQQAQIEAQQQQINSLINR